jgi:predicted RNA-binding Zn-ribbon protein involved in translation (DUF1610 family)
MNRPQMTKCYDCGNAVSASSRVCPHCGSSEPWPYHFSRREQKRLRAEARNDNRLIIITAVCIAIGIIAGLLIGRGILYQGALAVAFGMLGALIGPPIAFAINMLWMLRP